MPVYKDYTVVTDREIFAYIGAILSKNNPGAFVETAGNSVYSFGQGTSGLKFISTRSISYLSKYSYCGQSITAGAAEDGTDMWLGTVLNWLIINRPFAHIGIIVSNGLGLDEYRQAEIEIANKWGIPYIDLNGDERTPMMLRSTNPAICDAAKNARLNAQRISSTNQHPNSEAYEYESTFIEQFLRTL